MNIEKIANELHLTPWEVAALTKVVKDVNDYTDNLAFHNFDSKKDIINAALPEKQAWNLGIKSNGPTIVLTREQEEIAFLKYNYARFLINHYATQLEDSYSPALVKIVLGHVRVAIDVRNYLLEMNLKLIVAMIKRRIGHRGDMDNLFSDGQMHMINAIKKFDVSQGTKFSTYAFWAILRGWNKTNKKESERLIKEGMYLDGREGTDLDIMAQTQRLSDDNKDFCIEALIQILDSNIAQLSADEIRVLKCRYFVQGKKPTIEMVSNQLNIKKHKVTKLEKSGLGKIHRVLEREFLS